MASTRIFIGNLSIEIDENDIKNKFASYGTVNSVDLKNKLDIEGNPVSRFAYLNLVADPWDLQKCIQNLNGSQLKNSQLKVQIAKENFLDRLKREREEANQPKVSNFSEAKDTQISYNFNFEKPSSKSRNYQESRSDHLSHNVDNSVNYNTGDRNNFYKNNNNNNIDNDFKNVHFNDKEYEKNTKSSSYNNYDNSKDGSSYGDDDFKSFPTFKRYDPTVSTSYKPNKKKTDDHLSQNVNGFVNIYSELNFKEDASSFSLLGKFSALQKENEERKQKLNEYQEVANIEEVHREDDVLDSKDLSKPKSRNFFTSSDDSSLQGAVDWIITPLTKENQEEFESIKSSLVELSKLRQNRAIRDKRLNGKKSRFTRFNKR